MHGLLVASTDEITLWNLVYSLGKEFASRVANRLFFFNVDSSRGRRQNSTQQNFSGSNPDGSFTTAVSKSFLSPLEKIPKLRIRDNLG